MKIIVKKISSAGSLSRNFLYSLGISLVFIGLELIFRLQYSSVGVVLNIKEYLAIFVLFFIVSFLSKKLEMLFLLFIAAMFVFEVVHFNFFGYFIFPTEFILLFSKSNEIIETLVTVSGVFVVPVLYAVILTVALISINKVMNNRTRNRYVDIAFLVVIVLSVLNTGLHMKKRVIGDRPDEGRSLIKTSLYTVQGFIGKTLPVYLLDVEVVAKYKPEYTLAMSPERSIDTIVFILGESLSMHYMSVFGYDKKTTPRLKALVENNDNVIAASALSAGVFTDTSIPMILGMSKKPDAIEYLLSNETNLFKLAGDAGYETYWASAHAKDGFSNLRSYLGLKYIDHYKDSSNFGYDDYTSALDDVLIEGLHDVDFSKKNFIVLNMIGSHSPYELRVRTDSRPFGSENMLQHYENSVAYTDHIVADIFRYLEKHNQGKTLVIFTSDHGQNVKENQGGHGNIQDPMHYEVPLLIYSRGFKLDDGVIRLLKSDRRIPHYIVSLITAYYMGYDTDKYMDVSHAYIIGNELSGSSGYVEYDLDSNTAVLK